jgi:hypothetical protein
MPIVDALTAVPEQVLETISATQDLVVNTVTTVTEATKPLIERLPSLPFADKLPNPAAVVQSTFSTAEKLLANQKDLSLKLIDASRRSKGADKLAKKA